VAILRTAEISFPKDLAQRIFTSKAALEGERKRVRVLFADLKGSMEMLADRDPEEARKLLDPVSRKDHNDDDKDPVIRDHLRQRPPMAGATARGSDEEYLGTSGDQAAGGHDAYRA
jgi:hypothetical protein